MATALHLSPSILSIPPALPPRRTARAASGATRADSAALTRIGQHLGALRKAGRRAVAIIDFDCGDGAVALAAGRKARMLGFLAISVRGIDRSGANIRDARRRAAGARDPAIGFQFETRSDQSPPAIDDAEADIVLLGSDRLPRAELARICASPEAIVRHG